MIAVERAGLAAVTDLGRAGLSRLGIPANGAADQYSAAVANILCGNAERVPLIEITASGFAATAGTDLLVAITGAPATITIGGRPARMWEPSCVAAGERITVDQIHDGLRVYLAVHGILNVPHTLGSCAVDPLLGVGTWLHPGVTITVDSRYRTFDHPHLRHPVFRFQPVIPRFGSPWTIDVTEGPDAAEFGDVAETLLAEPYTVSPDSNHIGLRLDGRAPTRDTRRELLSRGVPVGAVEVPPGKELLVVLRGRPVTAGYPVVAVATAAAQQRLGQVAPGQVIRFRHRTIEAAIADYRAQRHALSALTQRVTTAFTALGRTASGLRQL